MMNRTLHGVVVLTFLILPGAVLAGDSSFEATDLPPSVLANPLALSNETDLAFSESADPNNFGDSEPIIADSATGLLVDAADMFSQPCPDHCSHCRGSKNSSRCNRDRGRGLVNRIRDKEQACWTGRVDALLLWRNAPYNRPLFNEAAGAGATVMNANQLNSPPAAGPRFSLFRTNSCGDSIEVNYFRAFNFDANRSLPFAPGAYTLSPPTIYGITPVSAGYDQATVNLGSAVQGVEVNGRVRYGESVEFLTGFRWIEWRESMTITDSYTISGTAVTPGGDIYTTNTINDLYGVQIGVDSNLWDRGGRFRVEGLVKAGAYINVASQNSTWQYDPTDPFAKASVAANSTPAAFVGEVGLTGVYALTKSIDFRFGYMGLWLESIVQPTNILSIQNLSGGAVTPPLPAITGDIAATGGVVLQGLTLGLEGRW